MNGRSKSVVVTFVVAMAVGVVAEARGHRPGGRHIGAPTFARRVREVGVPARGRVPKLVTRDRLAHSGWALTPQPFGPRMTGKRPQGIGNGARIARGRRYGPGQGDELHHPGKGVFHPGDWGLKRGFDGNRDGDLKPGDHGSATAGTLLAPHEKGGDDNFAAGHGFHPQGSHDPNGLYDSPGDDTFGTKVPRKRFLLGVGDGFALPDMRVRPRDGAANLSGAHGDDVWLSTGESYDSPGHDASRAGNLPVQQIIGILIAL